jgi:hypothetical protein
VALAPVLTSYQSIALLVGVPLALFLLIALAIAGPGLAKRGRYRPGLGWEAAPVWFNGPEQPAEAAKRAEHVEGPEPPQAAEPGQAAEPAISAGPVQPAKPAGPAGPAGSVGRARATW